MTAPFGTPLVWARVVNKNPDRHGVNSSSLSLRAQAQLARGAPAGRLPSEREKQQLEREGFIRNYSP